MRPGLNPYAETLLNKIPNQHSQLLFKEDNYTSISLFETILATNVESEIPTYY